MKHTFVTDARPPVYHSDHQALSTARVRRAGLLADSCFVLSVMIQETLLRRRAESVNNLSTVETSCTTNPQQIAVMELEGYS